jgi:hypothetical protein
VSFSPGTLQLFARLLEQVSLSVQADDFEETAQAVIVAKKELEKAVALLDKRGAPKR